MKTSVEGVSLSYDVRGTGDPVLFVHGFPLSAKLWDEVVEPMTNDYTAIVPDIRGHGESEASEESSMERYADDLLAILDEIPERRPVVLVGLSMGGYIAFEFYRRYPERVRALVLSNTRAGADSEEAAKGRYDTAEKVLQDGSSVVADTMVRKLFASETSDDLRSAWQKIMADTPPAGVAAALRAMAERPDSTETLDAITRPVLIVVGEEDSITPVSEAEAMHDAIAGSQLEVVPGAGHMTPVEQPHRFLAILQQFLDDLDPLSQQGWSGDDEDEDI